MNARRWSLIAALVLVVSVGFFFYRAGTESVPALSHSSLESAATARPSPLASLAPLPTTFRTAEEIERWIETLPKREREEKLATAFGSTIPGRQFRTLFLLGSFYDHSEAIAPVTESLSNAYRKDFLAHTDEAAQEIKGSLGTLSIEDFFLERAALVATLGTLPGHEKEGHELALREALASSPPNRGSYSDAGTEEEKDAVMSSGGPAYRYPVILAGHFLSMCTTAEEAKRGAEEILAAQKDEGVKNAIETLLGERLRTLKTRTE